MAENIHTIAAMMYEMLEKSYALFMAIKRNKPELAEALENNAQNLRKFLDSIKENFAPKK